jgi:hypothetical protein
MILWCFYNSGFTHTILCVPLFLIFLTIFVFPTILFSPIFFHLSHNLHFPIIHLIAHNSLLLPQFCFCQQYPMCPTIPCFSHNSCLPHNSVIPHDSSSLPQSPFSHDWSYPPWSFDVLTILVLTTISYVSHNPLFLSQSLPFSQFCSHPQFLISLAIPIFL